MTIGTESDEAGIKARYDHARSRLGSAQKSSVGVPAYLRFINRRAGGWMASVGYALQLTPNHLTALSAAFSFSAIAALCLVEPTPLLALLVTLALLVGFAFDSADGQLSRVRGDGRPSGEWLDHVVDVAKTLSLHAAVLVSLHRFTDLAGGAWLLVPIGYGIVNGPFFFGMLLRDQRGGRPPNAPGKASVARSLALLPMDYGTLCLVFVTLAGTRLFMGLYTGLFVFTCLFTVRSFVRAYLTLRS